MPIPGRHKTVSISIPVPVPVPIPGMRAVIGSVLFGVSVVIGLGAGRRFEEDRKGVSFDLRVLDTGIGKQHYKK
jgi:hypothetical protein